MPEIWFRHAKWPTWMVRLHYYSMVSFVLLLLSGIALFWPPVHTVLIPVLPVIYYAHITFGIVFAVTLLTPFAVRWQVGKLIRRLDWWMPLFLGTVIVLTGLLLWRVTWFPTAWRSTAFRWHGFVSYVLGGWLVIHGIYKAVSYWPSPSGVNGRVDPERRMFLRWLGAGVVGAAVITVLDPVGWLSRALRPSPGVGGNSTASAGFAEYYTVTGGYPKADLTSYQLRVDGLVEKPTTLSWADVAALKKSQETVDFHCVTGWSVANVQWSGIPIGALMSLVNASKSAKYVHFYSFDGAYTESLSLKDALDPTVMLATELNGQPLQLEQGYPVRLVVPKMYGYKSIKWVNRVEFSDKPIVGYWEARGYPDEATIGTGI